MRLQSSPWTSQLRPIAPVLVLKSIQSGRSIKVKSNLSWVAIVAWNDVTESEFDMIYWWNIARNIGSFPYKAFLNNKRQCCSPSDWERGPDWGPAHNGQPAMVVPKEKQMIWFTGPVRSPDLLHTEEDSGDPTPASWRPPCALPVRLRDALHQMGHDTQNRKKQNKKRVSLDKDRSVCIFKHSQDPDHDKI